MATRNRKDPKAPAPAKPAKETAGERHDRMMLEIANFMAAIDAALAECATTAGAPRAD